MSKRIIELLSPAKDIDCGTAAINYGADAVYIGAPKFGARKAAGNNINDIEKLIKYAHKYWAKVYITLNTILYNDELDEVRDLVIKLNEIGADALIIQDMAFLEMDIPPVPLFASTQTHNYEPAKIKFLESTGIKRVILARELSLDQIRSISKQTTIELETFIHGALCVCFSGQCYFSYATTGRSANRGKCSQPCRLPYSLIDAAGKIIVKDKHLLSLKDLNLSAHLSELIDSGITSFKIEGRLKDINYVKNITAYYRMRLDEILNQSKSMRKASSGTVYPGFTPDPAKSFNRGFTEYFYSGSGGNISSINTPKSLGEYIGKISSIRKDSFILDTEKKLVNGDGICFFDKENKLCGMNINKTENNRVYTSENYNIECGTGVYRNYDHAFSKLLANDRTKRKIKVSFIINNYDDHIFVFAVDEDGIKVSINETADSGGTAATVELIKNQFSKTGNTIFEAVEITVKDQIRQSLSVSLLNNLRRTILELLEQERILQYPEIKSNVVKNSMPYIKTSLDYKANVVNDLSRKFYSEHDVHEIENGFELQRKFSDKVIMTTKYCIKKQMKLCPLELHSPVEYKEPLYLKDYKRKYELSFDCGNCVMNVKLHE